MKLERLEKFPPREDLARLDGLAIRHAAGEATSLS